MHCACVIWDRCVKYRKLPFTGIAAANLFFGQDLTQTYHVRVIGGSKLTLGVNGCLFYMLAWRLVQRAPPPSRGLAVLLLRSCRHQITSVLSGITSILADKKDKKESGMSSLMLFYS